MQVKKKKVIYRPKQIGECFLQLPGIHALHDDLILFAFDHVISEHGVEVRNRGGQNDPVGTKLMLSHLQQNTHRLENTHTLNMFTCTLIFHYYSEYDTGHVNSIFRI